jgi:hypothetical protein
MWTPNTNCIEIRYMKHTDGHISIMRSLYAFVYEPASVGQEIVCIELMPILGHFPSF